MSVSLVKEDTVKIKNATEWNTLQLRAVFTRVQADIAKTEGKLKWPLTVRIVYGKYSKLSWACGGYAYLRSGVMTISTPHPDHHQIRVRDLAHTFMHELLHCYGFDHKRMTAAQMRMQDDGAEFAYVDGLPVERTVATPKPQGDVQVTRYLRIVAAVERNEAKLKRLERAHRKLTVRRKYYERVLSADGRLAALRSSSKG